MTSITQIETYMKYIFIVLLLSFTCVTAQKKDKKKNRKNKNAKKEVVVEEEYNPVDRYAIDDRIGDSELLGSLDASNFFSDAIQRNIQLYKVNSNVAYEKKDLERARFLYDSLVDNCLKGTHFDNFLVNKSNGNPVYFESFTKPIYLKTISTWCEPNSSESAAFNDLANEFGDLIDFVVLYWDPLYKVAQIEDNYSKNVTVLYVDESDNYSSEIVNTLKHSLGLPTVFLMDQNRTILNVRKGSAPEFTETPDEGNSRYGEFNPSISRVHFEKSYTEYFGDMVKEVNVLISNM